jgi:prevent-host-death family protein
MEVVLLVHIGFHETKTHLSEIIAKVCEGQEFTITRRGIPVARLVPAIIPSQKEAKRALERAKKHRENLTLNGLQLKVLIE